MVGESRQEVSQKAVEAIRFFFADRMEDVFGILAGNPQNYLI